MCFEFFRRLNARNRKAPPPEPIDPEYQELDDIMMYSVITDQDPEDLFGPDGE
jgi:hypothetical protein